MMDDNTPLSNNVTTDDTTANDTQEGFYAQDVAADAIAENDLDPDNLEVEQEVEVTSGEMELGDLDDDGMLGQGDSSSYDEEAVPAGDNVAIDLNEDDGPID